MDNVMVTVQYGYSVLYTRLRPEGCRWIGEGRRLNYDKSGSLIEDSGWKPSGVIASFCSGDEQT